MHFKQGLAILVLASPGLASRCKGRSTLSSSSTSLASDATASSSAGGGTLYPSATTTRTTDLSSSLSTSTASATATGSASSSLSSSASIATSASTAQSTSTSSITSTFTTSSTTSSASGTTSSSLASTASSSAVSTTSQSSTSSSTSSASSSTSVSSSTTSTSTSAITSTTSPSASTTNAALTTTTATTATGYQVPVRGIAQPTRTFTGSIQPLQSGTPVPITNPGFETRQSPGGRKKKRQSDAQLAAQAQGWTLQSCGTGILSDCQFENYDAATGSWAFSGADGGLLFQDGVTWAAGSTIQFTFYWKVVSTYAGAAPGDTLGKVSHGAYIGFDDFSDYTRAIPMGSATVSSGADWAMQSFTVPQQCWYSAWASAIQQDGTLSYRLFLRAQRTSDSAGSALWYLDEIRVQQIAQPSNNDPLTFMRTSCGQYPPSLPQTTYAVTQTRVPTSSPTAGSTNLITNPSFEQLDITDQQRDVVGFPTKPRGWTFSGCKGRQCNLQRGSATPPACQDGQYCAGWTAPTTYSQVLNLTVGRSYYLSLWTLLPSAPLTKSGASTYTVTLEPTGAWPGAGTEVLGVSVGASQVVWTESSVVLDVDLDFARQCDSGATAGSTVVACKFTIATGYSGSWVVADQIKNYFDSVSVVDVSP